MRWVRLLRLLLAACVLAAAAPAWAEVNITFYSKPWDDLGYPHAFIRVTGQLAGEAAPRDETYSFTTDQHSRVFFKARGYITTSPPEYVAASTPHFWLTISDDEYRALRTYIDQWGVPPGSDYNLYRRNCIIFVAEVARTLGLTVGDTKTLDPGLFMGELLTLNAAHVTAGLAPPALQYAAQPVPPPAETRDHAAGLRPAVP